MHVAAIRHKSDVGDTVEKYKSKAFILKYFPRGVLRIRSDGGGVYAKKCN